MKNWIVKMEQLVDNDKLDHDDNELYGVSKGNVLEYIIQSEDDIESAKDVFHDSYAIACLDDWNIEFTHY